MKILILLLVVTITSNAALAFLAGSEVIQNEFDKLIDSLSAKIANESEAFVNFTGSRIQRYSADLQSSVDSKMFWLGESDLSRRILKDSNALINVVKEHFSEAALRRMAASIINELDWYYLEPLQDQIDDMKDAVDENPRALYCWDQNKKNLKSIFNESEQQTENLIHSQLDTADNSTQSVIQQIGEAIESVGGNFIKSGSTDLNKYASFLFFKNFTMKDYFLSFSSKKTTTKFSTSSPGIAIKSLLLSIMHFTISDGMLMDYCKLQVKKFKILLMT